MESNRRPPPLSSHNKQGHDSAALFRARLKFLYHRRRVLATAARRAELQSLQFHLENPSIPTTTPPRSNFPPNVSINLDPRPPASAPPSADAYENVSALVSKLKLSLATSKMKALPTTDSPQPQDDSTAYSFNQGQRNAFLSAVTPNPNALTTTPSQMESNSSSPHQHHRIDKIELEDTARRHFSQEFQALRFSASPDNPCLYFELSQSAHPPASYTNIDINGTNTDVQPSDDVLPDEQPSSLHDINATNTNLQPSDDDVPGKRHGSLQDTGTNFVSGSSSRPPLYVQPDSSSSQTAVATHALVPTSHNMFYLDSGNGGGSDSKILMERDGGHTAYACAAEWQRPNAGEGTRTGANDLSKTASPTSTPTSLIYLQNNSTRRRRAFFERTTNTQPFVLAEPPRGGTHSTDTDGDIDAVFEIDCTGNIKRIE